MTLTFVSLSSVLLLIIKSHHNIVRSVVDPRTSPRQVNLLENLTMLLLTWRQFALYFNKSLGKKDQ